MLHKSLLGTLAVFLVLGLSNQAFATSDFLSSETIQISSPNPEQTLNRTVADIRGVFERYVPGVDGNSKIVSPLRVTGSATAPEIQVSIQRCVLVLCQTVDLDAEISVRTVRGPCAKNLVLIAELRRSSKLLTDVYDRLQVTGCFQKTGSSTASVQMSASAHRAPSYSPGTIQGEVTKMVKLQIHPILRALDQSFKANGLMLLF